MDPLSVGAALVCGLAARYVNLPPLVGFLAAGFVLKAAGVESGELLTQLAEFGVTLLLFSIGLKLDVQGLLRPQVWAVASLHMLIIVVLFGLGLYGLALAGLSLFAALDPFKALLLAFALSFSSTVFAVKVLEEKDEMASLHGTIAIGILITQDLFAVGFLAVAGGKIPTLVGLIAVVALVVFRRLLLAIMLRCGHGELLLLFGVLVAIGGAEAFEAVGVKGDLGALFLGCLLANHAKSKELAKSLLGFKDLFLVGFFLTIGLSGTPTLEIVAAALFLAVLMPLKVVLFLLLLTRFGMRGRSSLLASLSLANYSEFGLICCAITVAAGWLSSDWLLVLAISMSVTFLIASALHTRSGAIFHHLRNVLSAMETGTPLAEEAKLKHQGATVAVFGMGRIGVGAYDQLRARLGESVLGVDSDPEVVAEHVQQTRRVVLGDALDRSFWERLAGVGEIQIALLTMSKHEANLQAARELSTLAQPGLVLGAAARSADEASELRECGVSVVLNFYEDAGGGLAEHLLDDPSCQQVLAGSGIGRVP